MKFKKIAAFILAAALLSGCAVREDYSEYISEPVQSVQSDSVSESSADISDISIDTSISEESSDDEEINTSVYAEKYSNFGAIVNFENEDKIEYNGGNVTVPISVGLRTRYFALYKRILSRDKCKRQRAHRYVYKNIRA